MATIAKRHSYSRFVARFCLGGMVLLFPVAWVSNGVTDHFAHVASLKQRIATLQKESVRIKQNLHSSIRCPNWAIVRRLDKVKGRTTRLGETLVDFDRQCLYVEGGHVTYEGCDVSQNIILIKREFSDEIERLQLTRLLMAPQDPNRVCGYVEFEGYFILVMYTTERENYGSIRYFAYV